MNYRQATTLADTAITAAGTKTIDILDVDPISRIEIKWKVMKSKHAMDGHPAADITSIKLVDGSDVLHYTTGYENQAVCIYDRKCPSMCEGEHIGADYETSMYGIDFGRKLWDRELAFDPKRFKNPQLQITYVLTSSDSGASAAQLEVISHLFDERAISPVGFLMTKEHYSYTCGADGSFEYIELPRDYPYRKLFVRGGRAGYEAWNSLQAIRLDEENLKRIPIDTDLETYWRRMWSQWQPVQEGLTSYIYATARTYYTTPGDYWVFFGSTGNDLTNPISSSVPSPGGKVTLQCNVDNLIAGHVFGFLPNQVFEFPFGDPNDLDDWYDVTPKGSLRLRLEAGSGGTSGTGQVVLQQLRRY